MASWSHLPPTSFSGSCSLSEPQAKQITVKMVATSNLILFFFIGLVTEALTSLWHKDGKFILFKLNLSGMIGLNNLLIIAPDALYILIVVLRWEEK